jgi:aldehyde:ferredoxin oxidoreductase
MYGWMGTILRVDLTSGKIEKEPLSDRLRLNYIGGRGINSRILYDSVGPEVAPLSPENVLIFGTGPVVGTIAPSACRITVTAKSPLTGILGDANAGGHFSAEMKQSGYDHIVFTGKAERPVYLWIGNDHVELRSAEHIWGKTTSETDEEILRLRLPP